jgi:mannose-6-phosphate isomerase-like protein (cupin superfamily)
MKKGFHVNIEDLTMQNTDFRRVLYTGEHSQLVLMSLKPGEEIGVEVHDTVDQFFRFELGTGKVIINGFEYSVSNGDVVIVPAGSEHNVINTSTTINLQLYTVYSPANHIDGTVHKTKADAVEEHFDGKTTE